MPAYTVSQLEPLLGQYLAPNAAFSTTLAQVLPRIYATGMWRDLVYETSLNAAAGYISLPADAESVIACTINDNPRPVRSLWSDVKIVGRQPVVSPYFGIVDDGFHPVILDMKDVQGVESEEDVTELLELHAYLSGTAIPLSEMGSAVVEIVVNTPITGPVTLGAETDSGNLVFSTAPDPFNRVERVTFNGVPQAMDLRDPAFPEQTIVTIPAGTGVLRFRRFRVSDADDDTTVHLLVKRACPTDFSDDTIIHLGNINAIKHGMLGSLAEDHADLERANYHWGLVRQLLDEELDAFRGAAKPTLTLNIWGDSKPFGLY